MEKESFVKKYGQWQLDMMQAFIDMRDAQKDYFSERSEYKKKVAIAKEQVADQWLDRAIKAGLICHKQKAELKSQPKLF